MNNFCFADSMTSGRNHCLLEENADIWIWIFVLFHSAIFYEP